MGNIVVAPPNSAVIVSGCRGNKIVLGKCGFALWFVETARSLSLEIMTITVNSNEAETAQGVKINLKSYAQVKVRSLNADGSMNMDAIKLAATNFLSASQYEIEDALQKTLEGHQRQIVGTLTVEELYKDRAAFCERVYEHVVDDLERLGFELPSYTVAAISDMNGYMDALGKTQTAIVAREAAEGTARNDAEARKAIAKCNADSDIVAAENAERAYIRRQKQEEAQAEADRLLDLRKAKNKMEINKAEAEAVSARDIEYAKQKQAIVEAQATQKLREEEVMLKVKDIELQQRVNVAAREADALKLRAEGASKKEMLIGKAQADVIKMKGQAENDILRKRAEVYKEYGHDAIVQNVVDVLPSLAREIAQPLGKTEKMIFVSSDGSSASNLSKDIIKAAAQLPDAVESLTGLDLKKALKRIEG
ncbi:flotillin [Chloropicon primus]|uniref:Flotillin-like n=1 Tax=Chloropicon primus TaxID=1764295 RepID=A0A5B8MJ52_9CHLO|nr:flotillin [Chloropicon primus]UPQ98907.1 flotillin [Chloropicon primus]|eukprot:QDZ19695.1 flotillin [Chloropicon primus]